ncbi:hypothetical protein BV372_11880 [Nostoc sp. T09]|uniref:hypothetical protein n=1 Tax=Nostoc sp. T09 TaxID=1932621 RepID=UPI000B68822F|nr:hypothetical protein [Nostoc sp. T09]OUL35219.1 hypothetical protein BV372_11880 [Nostoc sp. T09]
MLPDLRERVLELECGLWPTYQQATDLWLRWYNAQGSVPTLAEQTEQERQRAERLADYCAIAGSCFKCLS